MWGAQSNPSVLTQPPIEIWPYGQQVRQQKLTMTLRGYDQRQYLGAKGKANPCARAADHDHIARLQTTSLPTIQWCYLYWLFP